MPPKSKSQPKDYSAIALKYCNDILSGEIPSCKLARLACQRHLNDLEKSKTDPDYLFYYDSKMANRRCQFSEKLVHLKGPTAGQKFILSPYQVFWRCVVWGWLKKKNHKRRFRTATIFLPRKQGKSFDAADTGLYMLCADGEPGSEVYSGASTEKQALEVFRPAWQIVNTMPSLKEHFGLKLTGTSINPTSIYRLSDMSRFEIVLLPATCIPNIPPPGEKIMEPHNPLNCRS